MADYDQLVKQLSSLFMGGQMPQTVERGVPHPGDTSSPFQMTPGERYGEIAPPREKKSFTDEVLGTKYADQAPRIGTAVGEMAGLPEPWARTLGASTDLLEQLMEAKGAVGNRTAPKAPPASRGKPTGGRGSRPKRSPLDFELQASLDALRDTKNPAGEALIEALKGFAGPEKAAEPLTSIDEILKMYPDITIEDIDASAGNLPINASAESGSGGSLEALNRTKSMAQQGRRFVRRGPGGQMTPSNEDGGIGLPPGWSFGVEGPNGFEPL